MTGSPRVAGVDGARGGWLLAETGLDDTSPIDYSFAPVIAPTLERALAGGVLVVIDMPIGLSTNGDRPVDRLVRPRLGRRRSSFFPTPIRAVLEAHDWADANSRSRAASGKGISTQAWNLVPHIREIDRHWRPALDEVVVEGHPETSFAELAGGPLAHPKSTPAGREERRALLRTHFGSRIDSLEGVRRSLLVDALDATVLCWTGARLAGGTAVRLGDAGDRDARGRPMWLTI